MSFSSPSRLFAMALVAAALGGCAHSAVDSDTSASITGEGAVSPETNRNATPVVKRRAAVAAKKHAPETKDASRGIASYYEHDILTASGEIFHPHELTAAHPSLPFGTRVRVTDLTTGRSVTVRINDRGPFIPGRIVDVSYGAAESLGILDRGITKVKLDVVP